MPNQATIKKLPKSKKGFVVKRRTFIANPANKARVGGHVSRVRHRFDDGMQSDANKPLRMLNGKVSARF